MRRPKGVSAAPDLAPDRPRVRSSCDGRHRPGSPGSSEGTVNETSPYAGWSNNGGPPTPLRLRTKSPYPRGGSSASAGRRRPILEGSHLDAALGRGDPLPHRPFDEGKNGPGSREPNFGFRGVDVDIHLVGGQSKINYHTRAAESGSRRPQDPQHRSDDQPVANRPTVDQKGQRWPTASTTRREEAPNVGIARPQRRKPPPCRPSATDP